MNPPVLTVMIGLVVVVSGFVGYNNIYKPHEAEVRQIQTKIAEETANQTMQADTAAVLKQVESYRKRLPPARDPAWLADQVLAIADRTGLQLSSIGRDAPAEVGGGLTRLSVSLSGFATYHEVGAFVDEVERSQSYLRIEKLTISPSGDATTGEKGSVQIQVSSVYVPPVVNQPK
jgi:Tfp pilus assembly protein PilO